MSRQVQAFIGVAKDLKMVDIIAEAPEGFGTSCELLNRLSTDTITELCEDVVNFLQQKIGAVKTDKWKQKLQSERSEVDETKTRSIINTVLYLYRAALKHRFTVEQFSHQLNSSIVLSDSTKSALTTVWATQGKVLLATSSVEQLIGVGQLIDVQWKVGVAISSEDCKSLNSPFVTLSLTVSNPSGQVQTHTVELTMAQFRNFTNQLKEIATVLETV